jgi:Cu(I)/Ag(I) efflux system membrane fusion protein/cobalt-zinc-cadmium efflux system membrane fusion protein
MTMQYTSPRSRRAGALRTWLIVGLLVAFVVGLAAGVMWNRGIRGALGLASEPAAVEAAPAESGQLWTCGMHPQVIQDRPGTCPICGMALTPVAGSGTAPQVAGGERKVKYWVDSMMSPPYISDKPGKSPMGMDLVPVYEDEVSAGSTLVIDPTVVQNMGLRVATVSEAALARHIRAVGYLEEAEPNRFDVNLRVDGWIDAIHADFEGKHVQKGEPLFDLYSPALQVAVEELIAARRMREGRTSGLDETARATAETLYDAALRKLGLYGVDQQEIEHLAALEHAPRAITFRAPATGHVIKKMVNAGAAVKAGDLALRIIDHTVLWLDVRVFAKDAPYVHTSQSVAASVEGRAGETVAGEVIFVHPHVDPGTRTAMVRIAVPNPALTLRPGMYATASLEVEIAPRAIVVPREAIIETGARQVAFVALDMGHFEPRKVEMGASGDGGIVQVLSGLAPGEQVVVNGQFLLDAESRMQEAIQRFLQQRAPPAADAKPSVAEPTTPAANELRDVSDEWKSAAEDALAAYLKVAGVLGRPQESDEPIDVSPLTRAASALRERAVRGDQTRLADALVTTASAMPQRPIAEQRKLFAKVSETAIELATRSPRTGELAPRVFVAHCPMVEARWLQASEVIANPYYATTMNACGEIERSLPIPGVRGDAPKRAHEGDHR